MKTIIVLEDEAECYDTLLELKALGYAAAAIDWERSKTILHHDTLGERRTKGYVEGYRDFDTYVSFADIHASMGNASCPGEVVLVLDLDIIRDAAMVAHYKALHGLDLVDDRLIGGTCLAIQAIHNPAIESLLIYPATKHRDVTDALDTIRHHIATEKKGRRRLYEGKEVAKFNTKEKALRILDVLLQAAHPLEEWMAHAATRTSKKNHENWGDVKRPEQLEFLWALLCGDLDSLDEAFGLLPGGRYTSRGLFCEGLKSFGAKSAPGLSLLNVVWVAMAVLRHELDIPPCDSAIFLQLQQRVLAQLDSANAPNTIPWSEDDAKTFAKCGLLPPQESETYRKSLMALYDMMRVLFRHKDDGKRNNILRVEIDHDAVTFVLDFPVDGLLINLRTMSACLMNDTSVPKEHDAATTIYEFWTLMQASDPSGVPYGSLAYTWGQSGMTLKKNGSTTELCFYVR